MTEETKPAKRRARKAPRIEPEKKSAPENKDSWVHIDDYLMTLEVRDETKQAFRIYMRRKAYQRSYEAFADEFRQFQARKI